MNPVFKKIKKLKNLILEILFPSFCLNCQKKNEILCFDCLSKVKRSQKILGSKIKTIFEYQDPIIKKVVWHLKYYHYPFIGEKIGEILYNEFLKEIFKLKKTKGQIWVIPVPLTKEKLKTRGYNQAQKIAIGFCLQDQNNFLILKDKIIYKKKETLPQAKILNKTERVKNIKNVFEIKNPEQIKEKNIIVIDDVITTGATIKEIIKILKKAGAKKVMGLAIAH